jgi:hypothetical protein
MKAQKYQVGEQQVMLREIGGKELPLYPVEIIGYEADNPLPYRIRYRKPGDEHIYLEDVKESRLLSLIQLTKDSLRK